MNTALEEFIEEAVLPESLQALKLAGARVQLIPFEGEGHGFFNPSQPQFEKVFSYVKQHVETYLLE
jgi:dipeptidyl aminopeptidase/acylaminoacyl peptidase